ncbi:MAG: hypothetical protein AAFR28_01620 [Pseudomonadota bacterium]
MKSDTAVPSFAQTSLKHHIDTKAQNGIYTCIKFKKKAAKVSKTVMHLGRICLAAAITLLVSGNSNAATIEYDWLLSYEASGTESVAAINLELDDQALPTFLNPDVSSTWPAEAASISFLSGFRAGDILNPQVVISQNPSRRSISLSFASALAGVSDTISLDFNAPSNVNVFNADFQLGNFVGGENSSRAILIDPLGIARGVTFASFELSDQSQSAHPVPLPASGLFMVLGVSVLGLYGTARRRHMRKENILSGNGGRIATIRRSRCPAA